MLKKRTPTAKILFGIFFLLFVSPTIQAQDNKNADDFLENLANESNDSAKSMVYLIDGKNAWIQGDMDEAESMFLKAVQTDKQNDAAHYELATVYLEKDDIKSALQHVQAAVKLKPKEKWYRVLESNIHAADNNYKKASDLFEDLIKEHPSEQDLYFEWVFMLEKGGMIKDAIHAFNQYENEFGIDEQIVVQKQHWYLRLGDVEGAADEWEKLIKYDPENPRYYVALAKMLEANDQSTKAAKAYERLREVDPDHPELTLSEARQFQEEGNEEELLESMSKVFADPNFDIDAKIKFLIPYINDFDQNEHKEKVLILCKVLTQTHPTEAKAFAMYGDFLHHTDQNEQALEQYHKAVKISPDTYTVWQQILFIDSDIHDYDALLKDSEEVLSYFPNQPLPYYFNAMAKAKKKEYQKAIKMLNRSLKLAGDNHLLKSQVFSSLGDNYRALKNYEASDSCFEASIKHDSNNAYVMNNYSYYLSLRNEKLDRAEELVKRAIELKPNNASFEDTLGWILYQRKKYKEAEEWLRRSLENGGKERSIILEHYGDVMFQLNKKEEAINYWKKAKEKGSKSELLDKKIQDGTLHE